MCSIENRLGDMFLNQASKIMKPFTTTIGKSRLCGGCFKCMGRLVNGILLICCSTVYYVLP